MLLFSYYLSEEDMDYYALNRFGNVNIHTHLSNIIARNRIIILSLPDIKLIVVLQLRMFTLLTLITHL